MSAAARAAFLCALTCFARVIERHLRRRGFNLAAVIEGSDALDRPLTGLSTAHSGPRSSADVWHPGTLIQQSEKRCEGIAAQLIDLFGRRFWHHPDHAPDLPVTDQQTKEPFGRKPWIDPLLRGKLLNDTYHERAHFCAPLLCDHGA